MKVLTTQEMREADRLTTERYGLPSQTLMENAGTAFTQFLSERFAPLDQRHIVVLCGKGNNGGDGLVVARKLAELGARPDVILLADPAELRGDAAINCNRLHAAGIQASSIRDAAGWVSARKVLSHSNLIVDAILGTGLRGQAEGLPAEVIEDVNSRAPRSTVVAVDIPSGISGDAPGSPGPAVVADCTITFTAPKVAMLASPASRNVGRLVVADIGTPRELIEQISKGKLRWLEPWEFRTLNFRRSAQANKGHYGHALIVAGSVGKAGAAALAARGALRVGAGLVTVATPAPTLKTVAGFAPEIMTEPLHATEAGTVAQDVFDSGAFAKILGGKNALAIGPGLTTHPETRQFVRCVVASGTNVPLILDADGLNAFAGCAAEIGQSRAMIAITPHPGEMARLLGSTAKDVQSNRLEIARRAAADWRAFVVLKGAQTVLAAPDGASSINSTGNPGLATGGTGDVLTGMLAGLTAEFGAEMWPLVLALGVYLHGAAGDLAAKQVGEASLIASDVIHSIPAALANLREAIERY